MIFDIVLSVTVGKVSDSSSEEFTVKKDPKNKFIDYDHSIFCKLFFSDFGNATLNYQ